MKQNPEDIGPHCRLCPASFGTLPNLVTQSPTRTFGPVGLPTSPVIVPNQPVQSISNEDQSSITLNPDGTGPSTASGPAPITTDPAAVLPNPDPGDFHL
ncbi:hypothetical protein L1987_88236 [Smallanthus sonchifolius]|nr:hypothetical protein L1987_88236 [Smallanthus sonchifolius]